MARRIVADGRYELESLPLARGGMGEVYLGRDTKLDREIAVKFIRFPDGTPDDELVRRFVRESRITARLEHPGVPAIYDVGTHESRPYLVMQRVQGVSVADLVAETGPLPAGWAAAIAAQVCAVLSVAHRASLVHRDLKPSNLMLAPDGTVKVLDFGLAVALDMRDGSQITRTGQALGTPAYMAPEQVMAAMSGPGSDLYALGCTLHEMLAGTPLFTGSTAYAVMSKQVDEPPRPLRAARPDVPAGLETLVLSLLCKRPEDRPSGADSVYTALVPHIDELPPLPAARQSATLPNPVRMYASVVGRVFAEPAEAPAPEPASGDARDESGLRRDELERVRRDATELVRQSRYSEAAEVLAGAVEPATRVMGGADADVVSLRLELANVRFEGGDYRGAAPVYRDLVVELAARDGADAELVFRCRMQQATCHALTGEVGLALRELRALLADEHRLLGESDPRVTELRRQIGLLELGSGSGDEARQTLTALLGDLNRLRGPEHAETEKVRRLVAGLPGD